MFMAGIPFMLTNVMKDALRSRGLTDAEIEQITPAEAQKLLLTPDARAVREFIQAIVTQAKAALGASSGLLQLTRLHPTSETLVPSRFGLDDIERMVNTAIGDCEAGHNVYIEGRVVPTSLRGNERGRLPDTVAVFALVIDSDADKGMGWTPPATIRPSMTVETSPGNFQFWFFFRAAVDADRAQKLGERIRRAVNSDSDTGNPTQPYRIAGTINYPNAKKVARGRDTVWTRLIALDPAMLWTPEDIELAFPAAEQPKTNGGAPVPAGNVSEADIPSDTMRVIRDGPTGGNKSDRSLAFFNIMIVLKGLGFTVEGILELLERHPNGVAKKYEGRLRREIERVYNKIDSDEAEQPQIATASVPGVATPAPAPTSTSPSTPQPLDAVHATFKKWLGEDYDTDVLDAVLAAGAAERLAGDPLWLLVISGPGNAKTETVQALSGAGAHITSTITSEGALLSASPRGRQATGGLLPKLGSRGLLVIKDVTSLLSMDVRSRSLVLAALREIYDGKWERNVGIGGGRTLTWSGRIAIAGACTTAWDTAHSVIAVMGDRFVIVRADSGAGRTRSAARAIGNTGREVDMRAELAAAAGALITNASTEEHQLTTGETDRLIKLANIVTWARTGVERDYRGEVVDAHALEMPTRFAKQLTMLVRGAVAIGMAPARAMRLASRCARDSLSPLRRRILLDVAAHPSTRPSEVARRIARPRGTVRRELQALHLLGALDCDEQDMMQGGRERTFSYYDLSPMLDRQLLLSM
jgi:RepB DNA-primase from phage plasmid